MPAHLYKLSLAAAAAGIVMRFYCWADGHTLEAAARLPGRVLALVLLCLPYLALAAAARITRRHPIAAIISFTACLGYTIYGGHADYEHYIHLNKESGFDSLAILFLESPLACSFALIMLVSTLPRGAELAQPRTEEELPTEIR